MIVVVFLGVFVRLVAGLNNCPTATIRSVIERAADTTDDAIVQMQMIRRILEDVYGGTWGVLIVRDPALVSKEVHWTFPDHSNDDGSPAFCLAVVNSWQYNVFKTGRQDAPTRVTVDALIESIHKKRQNDEKLLPRRYTVAELDRLLAGVIATDVRRQGRVNRSPRLVQ